MIKVNLKKYLAGLLAAVMTFTSVPGFVQAETDKDAVILYTNDVHCAIDDYSKLAAYAAQLEADGQEVVIVDAGDAIQGEVIGTLTEGEAIIDLMNIVGYDYVIPGNHEFDYGMKKFLELEGDKSDFEYLSSNFVDLRTDATVFNAYDIVELNGEKIAFVGITTPETLASTTPTYFQDENGNYIYGFSQNDLYTAVQKAVDAAIAEGAVRVIALGHLGITGITEGWRSVDVIANTTGIDVLLDGHSEEVIPGTTYENKAGEEVLLSSTGLKFANFGKLTLDDDNVEKTELIVPENVDIESSESAKAAYNGVQTKIDKYHEQTEYLYEVIGTSEAAMITEDSEGNRIIRNQETNMGDFATDAYKAGTEADIAISNSGGIRSNFQAGEVTRKTLMDVNPYGNSLCVVKATGQQIIDALEFGARMHPALNGGFLQVSGLQYEVHNYIESPIVVDGNNFVKVDDTKDRRVQNVKVNGEAIDLEKEYTVAATTYLLLNGGDGFTMFKGCEKVSEDGLASDAEMLIQYLTEDLNGVISKTQYGDKNGEGRIKIVASEEEIYHNLKVAGVSVNSSNAEDILGDGTASYDLKTNTLTLNNADLYVKKPATGNTYGIRAEGSITIELKGTNKINCEDLYGIAVVAASDGSAPNVKISGDGSLESYGSDGGILIRGSLTIGDSVEITGKCGDVSSGNGYGIRAYDDLTICDDAVVFAETGSTEKDAYALHAADEIVISDRAKVTVKAGEAGANSYGIYSGDNFTASGDALVNTEGGKGSKRSAGLYAISNIYVKDNAEVTTLGAVNNEPEKFASESYGIRTTHMYISGGTLTTTGQGATVAGMSAGIFTQDFELTGGTVNANSVDAKEALSVGIQSTKTMKIMGGTLNATSGDTTSDSYAIDASNGIEVRGGVVNAVAGKGDTSHGIDTDNMKVAGGSVNVDVKSAKSQMRGIRSSNEITVSGGNVQVSVGSTKEFCYGILAGASINITGGKVFVENGEAERASAIHGWGDINIKDAEVAVISKGEGIVAPIGSVNISSEEMLTKITVDTESYGIYAQKGIDISDNLMIDLLENAKIFQGQTEEGEQYSYIGAEDGSIAVNLAIRPIENDDTEKSGDVEEPGDVEGTEDENILEDVENVKSVQTGDQTQLGLWIILCVAMLSMIGVIGKKKFM